MIILFNYYFLIIDCGLYKILIYDVIKAYNKSWEN